MSAPRVNIDIDASLEKLVSLECRYAAEALDALAQQ